jgi:hypothetical protein
MTRNELFSSVRSYADRPNMTDDDLKAMLLNLEAELNRALAEHPRSFITSTYLLAAGVTLIPLPVDLFKLVTLRYPATQTWVRYPPDTPLADLPLGAYIDRGTALELPGAFTEEVVVTLDYYIAVCTLGTANTENWVTRYYPDLYLYGLLRELAIWTRDSQQLESWGGEYGRRLQATIAQGWDQNTGAAPRTRR